MTLKQAYKKPLARFLTYLLSIVTEGEDEENKTATRRGIADVARAWKGPLGWPPPNAVRGTALPRNDETLYDMVPLNPS